VFDIPDGLSFEEAAGFPVNFLTAHNVLFEWGGLEAGERVLIHAAAGGVGSAAVQLARTANAEIFATASTDAKLELAERLGADHLIDYVKSDFVEAIDRITDGEGTDLVLDGVGGDAFDGGLEALAPFGRLVSVGSASGREGTLDPSLLRVDNQRVLGYHLGTAMEREPNRVKPAVSHLYDLIESGKIEVIVDQTFPLNEAAKAHDSMESRRSVGKMILLP
jgi:NADPH2:quinone reductase